MAINILADQVDKKEIEIIIRELRRVIEKNIVGDVTEFGCYLGATSIYLADTLRSIGGDRELYVYDSFAGLPEKTKEDASPLGEQFKTGELCASKKQFIKNLLQVRVPLPHIKKAWFSDLTSEDIPDKIAFAFLDGDYYSSIMDSMRLIESHLMLDATVVVDDYGNAALPGVSRAIDELLVKCPAIDLKIEQSLAILYIHR
jgi:O-methyltransferase